MRRRSGIRLKDLKYDLHCKAWVWPQYYESWKRQLEKVSWQLEEIRLLGLDKPLGCAPLSYWYGKKILDCWWGWVGDQMPHNIFI